ncbi:transcriptional corepressor SEUSS-like isoform X2 [Durio zibethinus]|uniref:Transcriptional corepressor SEUSS-like isoform X2 n=1 Tax=Durio zibethinus TaxID=66656 RepID=A0A6P5YIW2_DURZI|nr:transcriptional corepressor SEUSS-like isoform X2 [Durio zibethinus]
MVPSGPSTPIGGAQSVSATLMRSNSAILGSQGGLMPQQATFSSLVSARAQHNMNLLGSTANISSLLNQTFGNGGSNSGLSGMTGFQRGGFDATAQSDPLAAVANDIGFKVPPSSFTPSNVSNSGSSGQLQNQQIASSAGNPALLDQQQSQVQQFEQQKFQHDQQSMQQFPFSHSQSQQQFRSIRGVLGGTGAVKLEPQTMNDQIGLKQQLSSFQNLGPVKQERQQNQIGRGIGPVKLERQQSDQGMLLQQQQQQQQQQFLQLSRQSSQAALTQMNLLQQQRILQMQHQQQLFKSHSQQRRQLQPQFQQQNLPIRSAARPAYEPGTCAQRLTQYIYQQQHRPDDNNIEFWRKFVAEFFAPNAKKRWCISLYGNSRQTNGVFPQDIWHCEICNCKPGRGFETTVEVLPRLFKIKYDSGTLEELLYVDMPREYHNANGQIILDYAKAIQESVFEHLRVVRDGQLRIVFSPDLKICSWEFCAQRHEELIPRRLIIPQVSQLGAAAQKYQASAQNASSNLSALDLQSNCNMFVASACQLAKSLDVPLVNDLGYTKRYVRCLQISEVVNSMKDLIDCSQETGMGPMESLAKFPRSSPSSAQHNSARQTEEQQQITGENANNDPHSIHSTVLRPSTSNGVASVNNSQGATSTSTSATTIVGLLRQNSMNSRIENQMNNTNGPYAGTPVQIPSAGSSTTLPPTQQNPSSPFSSPTPSSSNLPPQGSHNALASSTSAKNVNSANSSAQIALQQSSQSSEVDPNECQSSVETIIQEIMILSQFSEAGSMVSVGSVGNNFKNNNGLPQVSGSCLMGNGIINYNSGIGGGGFGNLSGGMGLSPNPTAMRSVMGNNSMNFTARGSMPLISQDAVNHQQRELAIRILNGLGAVNGFNNLQFDWKSP